MTNEELKKLSNDTFFDNDTGEIQPEAHRNFNNHLIDHTETVAEAALRNAKEYTDAREVAILAAADTKDADMLQRAKTYADQIVAALAGSAPETLDTLQELAAALGDDPNFSATVMQMIGERVTTEALDKALNGVVKTGDVLVTGGVNGIPFFDTKQVVGLNVSNVEISAILNMAYAGQVVQLKIRDYLGNLSAHIRGNTSKTWRELWHSGNFNPSIVFRADGYINASQLNDNEIAQVGNKACVVNYGGYGGLLVSFSAQASPAPLQFLLSSYSKSASLQWRHGVDANRFEDPSFRTIWDSTNLKPTYYAQIDPLGNIVSKSADWIQSVTWKSDGYGMQCYILPKMAVNIATAHVTKVRAGGNTFKGRAPVVCDELLDGCIVVATPGDSGASETSYFNISIQGA